MKQNRHDLGVALLLLVVCVLAYGLLIPTLGYYWDDWPYAWVNHMFGPSGYPDYVALDRPYSAWIFMALASVLGQQPAGYHISALLLFWLCAVLFWYLLRLIWPRHKNETLWAALLFTVYPGFLGHPQAIIYNHHFAAMALYLLSLIGMVRVVQRRAHTRSMWLVIGYHLPSVAALALSQFTIEYFLGWEMVRVALVWLLLQDETQDWLQRANAGVLHLVPYWFATLVFLVWRVLIFKFPTYRPLGSGESQFVLSEWITRVLTQFVEAVFFAWKRVFPQLSSGEFGQPFWLSYLALIFATSVLVLAFLSAFQRRVADLASENTPKGDAFARQAFWVALIGLVFAGWPFWLTNLSVNIRSPFNSRFTMAFMPWIAILLMAGLHQLAKLRVKWARGVTLFLIAFIVGGSTGYHYWNANFYRNEWLVTQRYFRQMVNRIPGLEPGTSLVINDLRALSLYQDDSLTAILNWTYAPDHVDTEIPYMVQYLSVRLGREIPALEPGLPIEHPFRSMHFSGSTDQILVVYYQPPGCLRVLDDEHPERLPENFPQLLEQALPLSDLSLIQVDSLEQAAPPLHLFDEGPAETWCLYFEQADLAGQRGDWQRVAALGDQAFVLEDQTNEVTELFVFIEGYLRVGELENAKQVSDYLNLRSGGRYDQATCDLWREIETEGADDSWAKFNLTAFYQQYCQDGE